MMHVKLLRYTPEPDRTVAMSARLCYSPIGAAELETKMSDKEVAILVRRLGQMGHTSTFEHVSFTFAIEGVSRVLTHQLVRHRIASYSQQSQRYVKEHDFETILPPSLAARPECKKEFQDLCGKIQDLYNKWTERHFQAFLAAGETEKAAARKAEKKAIEDARFVLPNACDTKMVVTMNARSLLHFFQLRCCSRAQWEIRALAWEMLRQVKEVAPILFEKAGPTCESDRVCHEGKMSCGRLAKLLAQDAAQKAAGENA